MVRRYSSNELALNKSDQASQVARKYNESAPNSEAGDAMVERMTDIAVLGDEVARLEAIVSDLNNKIRYLESELRRNDDAALNASDAELTIGELSRQLDIRDRTIADLQADRDRLLRLIDDVFNTISWKITGPLRRLKSTLRKSPPAS
ncbi:hypothetical protein [Paracoccus albus]|uniref:hypothetical protein n=1 Tax=Paracoccus albus TaxID=3017784 RepID=UPI0022F06958|nr:hypothetical protein [Paracoccus albus]WBU62049.1 hypothetical protein PAF20_17385 [Paracoccus albus]